MITKKLGGVKFGVLYIPNRKIYMPKISVLLSAYNAQDYLKDAIESILSQTFRDFEFIIIDDGSTDSTLKIIQSFNDKRIRIISHQKNIGLTKSLNEGLKIAKGRYIARMDADDISLPQRIEKQSAFLDKYPKVGIVSCWHQVINPQNIIIGEHKSPTTNNSLKKLLAKSNQFTHSSVMIQSDCLKIVGLYREEFTYAQDYDLWLRFAQHYDIAKIPDYLLQWRLNLKSLSVTKRDKQDYFCQLAQALAKQRRIYGYDALEISSVKKTKKAKLDMPHILLPSEREIISTNIKWANAFISYQQYSQAFDLLVETVKKDQSSIKAWKLLIITFILQLLPLSVINLLRSWHIKNIH